MSNLWRTHRPRIPTYISDGSGRDYYIKYNNAGYWDEQYKMHLKPVNNYPKNTKYYTLFHQAAPIKFVPTGNGRETYIINSMGQYHDQKPLLSYKLDDFLRVAKSMEGHHKNNIKINFMSGAEKKYNNKIHSLEKNLIYRLYQLPMKIKKEKIKKEEENNTLPNIAPKKENEYIDNDIINNTLKTEQNVSINKNYSKYGKFHTFSLKNNLILNQSDIDEKNEMTNNSRKNKNKEYYGLNKNGRIGLRMNELKGLTDKSTDIWNDNYNRVNTEINEKKKNFFSLGNRKKILRKNNLTNPDFQKYIII